MTSHRSTKRGLIAAGTGLMIAAFSAIVPATAASAPARARAAVEHVGHGAQAARIIRDSYGVPSIYATTVSGMWFGNGWAQAQDRLVQLELTRRSVEGNPVGDLRTFGAHPG
jgi:penicillin amidase